MAADASISIALKFLDEATAPMKRAMSSIDVTTSRLNKSVGMLNASLMYFVGIQVARKAVEMSTAMVDMVGTIERLQVTLRGVTDSTDEYNRSISYIYEMGAKTFGIEAVTDAFLRMKSAGIDPLNGSLTAIMEALVAFGNTAPESLRLVSLGFSQMIGSQFVRMQELRQQIAEQIPSTFPILLEKTGKSYLELTQNIEDGALRSRDAMDLLVQGFKERYGGSIERLSNLYSILKTRMEAVAKIGLSEAMLGSGSMQRLESRLKGMLDTITAQMSSPKGVEALHRLGTDFGKFLQDSMDAITRVFGSQGINTIEQFGRSVITTMEGVRSAVVPVMDLIATTIKTTFGMGSGDMHLFGETMGALFTGWGVSKFVGGGPQMAMLISSFTLLNAELERAKERGSDFEKELYRFVPTAKDASLAIQQISKAFGVMWTTMTKGQSAPSMYWITEQYEAGEKAMSGAREAQELFNAEVDKLREIISPMNLEMLMFGDSMGVVARSSQTAANAIDGVSKAAQKMAQEFAAARARMAEMSRRLDQDISLIGLQGADRERKQAEIEMDNELQTVRKYYAEMAQNNADGVSGLLMVRQQVEDVSGQVREKYAKTIEAIAQPSTAVSGGGVDELGALVDRWRGLIELPWDRLQSDLKEINSLLSAGRISADEHARATQYARDQYNADSLSDAKRIVEGLVTDSERYEQAMNHTFDLMYGGFIDEITYLREIQRIKDEILATDKAAAESWLEKLQTDAEKLQSQLIEIQRLVRMGLLTDGQGTQAAELAKQEISPYSKEIKELESVMMSMGSKFTETVVDMMNGGKANFSDLINSMIADILRLMMQLMILQPLIKSMMNINWSSATTNLFNMLFGGGSASSYAGVGTYGVSMGSPNYHAAGDYWFTEPTFAVGLNSGRTHMIAEAGQPEYLAGPHPSGSNVIVNVQNTGQEKDVNADVRVDMRGMYVDLFMQDMERNGAIRRSLRAMRR